MLDRLQPRPGATRRRKRVGRGPGSGHRKTSGRGIKGQGKRSPGRETPFYFEGGQMPLSRRLPKRGFHSLVHKVYRIVNLGSLTSLAGAQIDAGFLEARGLIRHSKQPVKLLAEGEAPKGLAIRVQAASAAARRKVEEAGGSVEIIA